MPFPWQIAGPPIQFPSPYVGNLPAFTTHDNYVEKPDPEARSKRHPLKLYRYRPDHESTSKPRNDYAGWKHLSQPSRHMKAHTSLAIVSWNLNFESQFATERVTVALEHLQKIVFGCRSAKDSPGPCVIMLQEVHMTALRHAIRKSEWIRKHFIVTPVDQLKWPGAWVHGNVSLVERTVYVRDSWMIEYGVSDQKRTALALSLKMRSLVDNKTRHVLLINTQLDDDPENAPYSRRQLRECARSLEVESESGGVVVGTLPVDLIANTETVISGYKNDEDFFSSISLVDAARNVEGEKGHTWGYQPRSRTKTYPKSNPDKILSYSPPERRRQLRVSEPKRVAVGLRCDKGWVSDHYGLLSTVEVYG